MKTKYLLAVATRIAAGVAGLRDEARGDLVSFREADAVWVAAVQFWSCLFAFQRQKFVSFRQPLEKSNADEVSIATLLVPRIQRSLVEFERNFRLLAVSRQWMVKPTSFGKQMRPSFLEAGGLSQGGENDLGMVAHPLDLDSGEVEDWRLVRDR